MVTLSNGEMFTGTTTYQWNTTGCYTNTVRNSGNPTCFPTGQTTQNVTDNNLRADDAGTITCGVTLDGVDFTSDPLTLRISGEYVFVVYHTVYSRDHGGLGFSAQKYHQPHIPLQQCGIIG